MVILHTADWHIGQLFHEYDRTYEHQQLFIWLLQVLRDKQVDVLLITGDVFDQPNPSATSVKMFYTFLNEATRNSPDLQIIITAGNHDSAARLESPKPLLETSRIHIVGVVEKNEQGNIDYEKLCIPLEDKTGDIQAWCLAIPFLRQGDYPIVAEADNPYTAGVARMYEEAYQYALTKRQPGQAIIAMGHLHTQQAELTDMDKQERLIMGGVECIGADSFPSDFSYVALGHIHKAQRIGGKENIRYCGSPLPMSFSEINYRHQVILFELEDENIAQLQSIQTPVSIPLLRVPAVHSKITDTLSALAQLPNANGQEEPPPYLEVCVLSEGPEPGLRYRVEQTLVGKYVRLARIDTRYATTSDSSDNTPALSATNLQELNPVDVFAQAYQAKYNNPVPEELMNLFNMIATEAAQAE